MKTKKYFLKLFFLIFLFNSVKITADGFNSLYPYSNSLIWIVGPNGKIYRSGDGGGSFSDRSFGSANYNSVCGKLLFIWISGDNGTIVRSTNVGVSFSETNIGTSDNLNSIFFIDTSTGWIAADNGKIFKSTNNGINWVQQSTPTSNRLNGIKFINSTTGAVCGNNGTVLITTDGGLNWNLSQVPVNKNLLSIDIISSTIYSSGVDAAVIKSNNLGSDWNIIDYKISTKPDIGIAMVNPDIYYSCGVGGFIRRSADGGSTFSFQHNPAWADLGKIYFNDSLHGWALGSNTNIVLRTINGGTNWLMPNGTTQTLSWVQKIPLVFYTSSGNVFYQSTWNKKEIFVTKSNTIYRTLNAGETWTPIGTTIPRGTISNSFCVSSRDTNIFMVAIDSSDDINAWVYRSTNYGQTWNISFEGHRSSDGTPLGLDPNHPDTVYYGLQDSTLFRTTNFGISWTAVSSQRFDNVCYIKVLDNNPNVILVGGRDNEPHRLATVIRSSNYGLSWTVVDSNTGEFPELPCIMGSPLTNIVYAAHYEGDYGGVKRSFDGGITWSYINIDEYVWGMDIAKDDPNVLVYADWGGGIGNSGFITFDGGVHFTLLPQISGSGNFAVYFYNRNTLFLQQPYGFYKLRAVINVPIGIQPVSTKTPEKYLLAQNYPNPFNPVTKIKFGLPKSDNVFLKIYNILGMEITVLVNETLKAGEYSVDWDAADYPSGVYFYKLITKNYSESKKMILLK